MEGLPVIGSITLKQALQNEYCSDPPIMIQHLEATGHIVDAWLYRCGLVVDKAFADLTQVNIVVPVAAAHRLHHIDKHQPLLPQFTVMIEQTNGITKSWCRDCVHMRTP